MTPPYQCKCGLPLAYRNGKDVCPVHGPQVWNRSK